MGDDTIVTNHGRKSPNYTERDHDFSDPIANSESRTPLKTPSKETEMKIFSSSINGDAKLDMDHAKSAFAGMSKEELQRYVNDPFWVRVRTVLFVMFWLIWVAMFAAAIAIIVMAPRCEAPTPRKWFQEGPIYEIDETVLTSELSLKALTDKMEYISSLNVKGVIIGPIFTSDEKWDTTDFKTIDPRMGTLDDFKGLLAAAKRKAIRVLLSLIPNHSSIQNNWFNKSIAREAPYDKYYVWAPKIGTSGDNPTPPNNWLSVKEGSAWEWNEDRKEFYLHQFSSNQPDLNFHNDEVRQEFTDILTYWLDLGVFGFNLNLAQFLFEDPALSNEAVGQAVGFTHEKYDFYSHSNTYNRPETASLLSAWRNLIQSKTGGEGLLVINGEPPIPTDSNATTRILDLVRPRGLLSSVKLPLTANALALEIQSQVLSSSEWPAVQAGSAQPPKRIADLVDEDAVDPLNMITLLLPGTPVILYGDELGLTVSESAATFLSAANSYIEKQEKDPLSHFQLFKNFTQIRESPSILYGASNVTVLNETLIVTRWKAGHPGFVTVYNVSPNNTTINLSRFPQLPSELTVFALGRQNTELQRNSRVPTEAVVLSPSSAIMFTFVPAEER